MINTCYKDCTLRVNPPDGWPRWDQVTFPTPLQNVINNNGQAKNGYGGKADGSGSLTTYAASGPTALDSGKVENGYGQVPLFSGGPCTCRLTLMVGELGNPGNTSGGFRILVNGFPLVNATGSGFSPGTHIFNFTIPMGVNNSVTILPGDPSNIWCDAYWNGGTGGSRQVIATIENLYP